MNQKNIDGSVSLSIASIAMIGSLFFVAFVKYIYEFLMARLLGVEGFGLLGLSESLIAILGLFVTYALPFAVTKFISSQDKSIFISGLTGNLVVSFITSIILVCFFSFGVIESGSSDIKYLIVIIVLTNVLISISSIQQWALIGEFRFGPVALLRSTPTIILLPTGYFLVKVGFGVEGALLGLTIGTLLGIVIGGVYTIHLFQNINRIWNKSFYSYAATLMIGMLGIPLITNLDQIAVKILTDSAASDTLSGYYRAGRLLCSFPIFVVGAFIGSFFPFISKYSNQSNESNWYILKSLKLVAAGIIFYCSILLLFPNRLILIFLPEQYSVSSEILPVLSVSAFFLCISAVLIAAEQAKGKPLFSSIIVVMACSVEIALLCILIPKLENLGAAYGTLSASLILISILGIRFYRSLESKNTVIPIIQLTISVIVALSIFYIFPDSNHIITIMMVGVCFGIQQFLLLSLRYYDGEDINILSNILSIPLHGKHADRIAKTISTISFRNL